jgi:dTDP-4-amino-4,6-dideoxygalactose transaminase
MNRNTDFLPFARPSIGQEEEEAVLRIMRSGWLTTGSEALAFEKEFAAYVGAPFASGCQLGYQRTAPGP